MSGRKTLDIDNITLRTIRAINPQTNLNPTANYILAADGSGNATWVNTTTNINTYGTGFTGSSGTGTTGPAGLGSYISATYAGDNVTPTAGQWSFDDAIGLLIGDTPLISTFMAYLTALVAGGNVYLDYIDATLNTVPFPPTFGFSNPPALASGVWTIQPFTISPIGLPTGYVFNFWVQGLSPYGSTGAIGPTGPGGTGGGGSSGTGATGPTGSTATINWTGPYNAGTTYNLNDGVIGADGYGYVLAALAPAGTAPPDSSYWALVASNIATGETGPTGGGTGNTGPTGPAGGGTGNTGPTGPAGGGTGATGPTGSVLIYATVFDGGNASTNYIIGPVFNCGGAQ